MNTVIKMAWRNIWRNKKRTALTMLSIILAIFLSLFTRSMQQGTFGSMITNAVKLSTGYIQIHKDGYWENKSINETFLSSNEINKLVESNKNIKLNIPRLESFALVSSGKYTKGAMIIGTIPELEDELNNYSPKVVRGSFINANDHSILIGDELANYLRVDVGDSLVLIGQGYHGVTAAGQYEIKGIIHLPIPQLNKQLVLMPLKECQYLYASENRLTSISIMLEDPELLDETTNEIKGSLGNEYEVMTWEELNKELLQFVDTKVVGGMIMMSILYIVIGFGVFGTVMMMTMERSKEFAIMVSIGMRKFKLVSVVFWETIFIGFVAVVIGIIITYPILLYLSHNPIELTGEFAKSMETVGAEPLMPFVIKLEMFVNQTISIIFISFIAVIYPLFFILKFDVLKAMRN
ncbi:MAG: ABC transporter permease [Ignavibacteriae bacterium]|nr:ABC transporter permease [Ignavibacteriota bacterium]